jgi:hypothetical protein
MRPPHPGRIVVVDVANNTREDRPASEFPASIAYARTAGGQLIPVVRLEIYRTSSEARISSYGENGDLLSSTVQFSTNGAP